MRHRHPSRLAVLAVATLLAGIASAVPAQADDRPAGPSRTSATHAAAGAPQVDLRPDRVPVRRAMPVTGTVTGTVAGTVTGTVTGTARTRTAAAAPAPVPALTTTGSPTYRPLSPARVLDVRGPAALGPGATLTLTLTGRGGVPATGVDSVVLNVTATGATAATYLSVYPAGSPRPVASNLNVATGATVANLVVATLGAGGAVTVYNAAGSTGVVVDVQGYFQSSSDYHALRPARVLDTRSGLGAPRRRVGAAGVVDLAVTGRGGVPASGVAAVALTVTAVAPTAGSFVTVFPSGTPRPTTSNLNLGAGRTVALSVVTGLSATGHVSLYNAAGTVDLLADVAGWFAADGDYHPVAPQRVLDTRVDGFGPLDPRSAVDLPLTGWDGMPLAGVSAVVLSLTAVAPTAGGYLTQFPYGDDLPRASTVNFARGVTTPNLVVARVGGAGWTTVYNAAGLTHVLVDVVGYLTTDAVPVLAAGQQVVASVGPDGLPAPRDPDVLGDLWPVDVSDDGRWVLFDAALDAYDPATPPGTPGRAILVRDTVLGVTTVVAGVESDVAQTFAADLSADGRRVSWSTTLPLDVDDVNATNDLLVTDLDTGLTFPLTWDVTWGDGGSDGGALSSDGRYASFSSWSTNFPGGATANVQSTWVRDLDTGDWFPAGPGFGSRRSIADDGSVVVTDGSGTAAVVRRTGVRTPVVDPATGNPVWGVGTATWITRDGSAVTVQTDDPLLGPTRGVADAYRVTLGASPVVTAVTSSGAPQLTAASADGRAVVGLDVTGGSPSTPARWTSGARQGLPTSLTLGPFGPATTSAVHGPGMAGDGTIVVWSADVTVGPGSAVVLTKVG